MTFLAKDSNGHHIQAIRPGTAQKVAYTNVAGQSTAFGGNTTIIQVAMTTTGFFAVGPNPTAVADGTCTYLPADTITFVSVNGGEKISFIRLTGSGDGYVTEGA